MDALSGIYMGYGGFVNYLKKEHCPIKGAPLVGKPSQLELKLEPGEVIQHTALGPVAVEREIASDYLEPPLGTYSF